ncbi:hypothetical protein BESB_003150 [Besnoitia besnoiti]|uniref:Uncharacterized protein n=1 Tax=Besnoitia besnoiti TaxID=94643 RepID=A0A2A9ML56_BESBE|nr:hypothetical protein BESB_003150 [Besnoitia besnoiti]PFH37974.1 hypothetical protein BESB_003150 [Besnoitia besnoiti]
MERLDQAVLGRLVSFLFVNEVANLRLLSKRLNESLFTVGAFRVLMRLPPAMIFPAGWGQEILDDLHRRNDRNQEYEKEADSSAPHAYGLTRRSECLSSVNSSEHPLSFNFLETFVSLAPPLPQLHHLTLHIPESVRTVPRSWLRTYHKLLCVAAPSLESLVLVELFSARLGDKLTEGEWPPFGRLNSVEDAGSGSEAAGEEPESPGHPHETDASSLRSEVSSSSSSPGLDPASSSSGAAACPAKYTLRSFSESETGAADAQERPDEPRPEESLPQPPPAPEDEVLPLCVFPRLRSLTVRNRGEWSGDPPQPCPFTYLFLGGLPPSSSESSASPSSAVVSAHAQVQPFPVLKEVHFFEMTSRGLEILEQFLVKHNVTSVQHLGFGAWHTCTVANFLLFLASQNSGGRRLFCNLMSLEVNGAGFIWTPDEFWYFYAGPRHSFTQIWRDYCVQHRAEFQNRDEGQRRAVDFRGYSWIECADSWLTDLDNGQAQGDNGGVRHGGGPATSQLELVDSQVDREWESDMDEVDDGLLTDDFDDDPDAANYIRLMKRLPRIRRVLLSGFVGIFVSEAADDPVRFFDGIFPQAVVDVQGALVISTSLLVEIAAEAAPHTDWPSRLSSFLSRKQARRARPRGQPAEATVSIETPSSQDDGGFVAADEDHAGDAEPRDASAEAPPSIEDAARGGDAADQDSDSDGGSEGEPMGRLAWAANDGAGLSERGRADVRRWLASGLVEDLYIYFDPTESESVHLDISAFHRMCVAAYFPYLGLEHPVGGREAGQDWGLPFLTVRHQVEWGSQYVQDFLDIATTFRHAILSLDHLFWIDRDDGDESESPRESSQQSDKNHVAEAASIVGHPRESASLQEASDAGVADAVYGESGNTRDSGDPVEIPGSSARSRSSVTVAGTRENATFPSLPSGGSPNALSAVVGTRQLEQECASAAPQDQAGEPVVAADSRHGAVEALEREAKKEDGNEADEPAVRLASFEALIPNVVGLLLPLYWTHGGQWPAGDVTQIAEAYKDQARVLCIKNAVPSMGGDATEADPLSLMARDFEIVARICRDMLRVIDYRVYTPYSWREELGLYDESLVPSFLREFLDQHQEFYLAKQLDAPPMAHKCIAAVGREALCQLRVFIWIRREVS